MADYSENTRIAAINLLNDLMRYNNVFKYELYNRVLFKLYEYPDFLKFLLNNFLSQKSQPENIEEDDYIKKVQGVVNFASKIAQRSGSKKCAEVIDTFKNDILNIFLFSYKISPECAIEATEGMFYLMRYRPEIVFYPLTESVIQYTIDNEKPEVIYFLLQILKVCNWYLPDDRLFNIYSQIDFNCFNAFMTYNEPLLFATSRFFCTLFDRGSQFIQFSLDNLDCLFEAYQDISFEIKYAILGAFDSAFINANWQQMSFFFENNYDLLIFDSISSHESISDCLDAIISITKFDPNRIKNIPNLISELEEIEDIESQKKKVNEDDDDDDDDDDINEEEAKNDAEVEEEKNEEVENKQKAMYLISIINQPEE